MRAHIPLCAVSQSVSLLRVCPCRCVGLSVWVCWCGSVRTLVLWFLFACELGDWRVALPSPLTNYSRHANHARPEINLLAAVHPRPSPPKSNCLLSPPLQRLPGLLELLCKSLDVCVCVRVCVYVCIFNSRRRVCGSVHNAREYARHKSSHDRNFIDQTITAEVSLNPHMQGASALCR